MASVALPKQLQHILKQANVRTPQHETSLHERAIAQMQEYLGIVVLRIGPCVDESDHAYDLSELLGFVHSQSADETALRLVHAPAASEESAYDRGSA